MTSAVLSSCNVGFLVRESHHDYLRFIDSYDQYVVASMDVDAFLSDKHGFVIAPRENNPKASEFGGLFWPNGDKFVKEKAKEYIASHDPNETERRLVHTSPHTSSSEIRHIYKVFLLYITISQDALFTIVYHLDGGQFTHGTILHSYFLSDIGGSFANLPSYIPDPEKEGYTFVCWTDEDGNPIDFSKINGDVELYAKWAPNNSSAILMNLGGNSHE